MSWCYCYVFLPIYLFRNRGVYLYLFVLWQRRSVGGWVITPPSSSLPWCALWSWFSSPSPCIYRKGNHRHTKNRTYSQKSPNRKFLSWPWRKLDRRPLRFMFYRTLCVCIWKVIHNLCCVLFYAMALLYFWVCLKRFVAL